RCTNFQSSRQRSERSVFLGRHARSFTCNEVQGSRAIPWNSCVNLSSGIGRKRCVDEARPGIRVDLAQSDCPDFVLAPLVDHVADDVTSKHGPLPFTSLTYQLEQRVVKAVRAITLGEYRVYDRPIASWAGEHCC